MFNGDFVIGVDNFCSSDSNSPHHKLIETLCINTKNKLFIEDITSSYFSQIANHYRFDVIYNFACPASPPIYQSMPVATMMTCVVGTKNVLDMAHQHNAIVVHASTSEVYGDPSISPQIESYKGNVNSYGERACYDEGKRAAEALCFDYLCKYETDVRLVRIFNTYGPHISPNDGRVISNFVRDAEQGKPLTIYGDGKQTRSFCYVDDLINGVIKLGRLKQNPRTPINIGNPNEFTMLELVDVIKDVFNDKKIEIVYRKLPSDDPSRRKPDITLAKNILNWEPKINLQQGLQNLRNYWKDLNI